MIAELESGERVEHVRPRTNGAVRRTVLAAGCFDLLHLGHIRHLQEARALGDELVVSVTADAEVRKGIGRPIFTAEQRAEALRSLSFVDAVIINTGPDAVSIIERVLPAVYVKGIDYVASDDAALQREIAAVEQWGGSFAVTKAEKYSSTRLINAVRLPEDAAVYLNYARQQGFLARIHNAFAAADALNIGFAGETIIDEYRYVSPLGRPAKESILSTVEAKTAELFEGGVLAAAKHADWRRHCVVTPEHGAICKTRFVDPAFNRKLFEVYSVRDMELHPHQRAFFQIQLTSMVAELDAVVALDFGHGLFGAEERRILQGAKFLAVNAQTNTGNYGFNPITKYTRADLICIDEPEARLATGMHGEPVDEVISRLRERIKCRDIVITHGREGCWWHRDDGPPAQRIPALAVNGIDTMGAGDAFLAVAAPLVAAGLDLEAAAFVGNVAGAIKIEIVGHRTHVTRGELMNRIDGLLA